MTTECVLTFPSEPVSNYYTKIMFKKLTTLVAILAVSAGTLFAQATKTAIINMDAVIQSFSKTPIALEKLKADILLVQEQEKSSVAELQKKAEALQKLVKEIENPMNSESAKEKAKAEAVELNKTILKERQELSEALAAAKRAIEDKRNAELSKIIKEIVPVIQEYAKANKIDIVLNTAPNTVVYFTPEADITKAIQERLAELFPAEKKEDKTSKESAQ